MRPAHVTGLGLWMPGLPSVAHFAEDREVPAASRPSCEALPARAKRGTSLVTCMAIDVASQAASQAGASLDRVAMVFGSALGEVQTAIDQMAMVESEDGLLSPTRFKNSVHNTASGLLSIASQNRGFSTAIAAGSETVAMCLLEAMALLEAEGGQVVVALADEPVPEPFVDESRRYDALALSFCLAAEPAAAGVLGTLEAFGRRRFEGEVEVPERVARNPIAAGIPLLRAVLAGASGRVPLELGAREPYCVTLRAEASR